MSPQLPTVPDPWPSPIRAEWQWCKALVALCTKLGSLALLTSFTTLMSAATTVLGLAISGTLTPPAAQAHTSQCAPLSNLTEENLEELEDEDLRCLKIEGNGRLTKINLSDLQNLTHLYIRRNDKLTEISLPESNSLMYLSIANNENLEKINLQDLTSLTCLTIDNNDNLLSVNLSELSQVKCLRISNNKCLTAIKIPKLTKAKHLHIYDNAKLDTIELSKTIKLMYFYIRNNPILDAINFTSTSHNFLHLDAKPITYLSLSNLIRFDLSAPYAQFLPRLNPFDTS